MTLFLGLDNVTRRRLGRIARILLEPVNFLPKHFNRFFERLDLGSLFLNNQVFGVHAPVLT